MALITIWTLLMTEAIELTISRELKAENARLKVDSCPSLGENVRN